MLISIKQVTAIHVVLLKGNDRPAPP